MVLFQWLRQQSWLVQLSLRQDSESDWVRGEVGFPCKVVANSTSILSTMLDLKILKKLVFEKAQVVSKKICQS